MSIVLIPNLGWPSQDLEEDLAGIYRDYLALEKEPAVGDLVSLDQKLRAFIEKIPRDYEGSAKYHKPEYEVVGLFLPHYGGGLGYSGKLLVEAHRSSPNSRYRNETLFATILGERSSHGLAEMPDLEQAFSYIKEFPDGPHAAAVFRIIGHFYDDLGNVLHGLTKNNVADYKFDCFKGYLSKRPHNEQLIQSEVLALQFYLESLSRADPTSREHELTQKALLRLGAGKYNAWYWCGD